ncbi:retrovirus-related pol polyprotein from transposon TNT 1-94 [Tanacetum coccineum]
MNELVNDGIKLSKLEINTGFINGLPKKWLSFCQSVRNINNLKDSELASLFGNLKYEENLIDNIYETKKNKSLVSATPLSTAFFSFSIVQDFQDSPVDEEVTRSIHAYLNDLEEEYQAKALLSKSKRFFKNGTQRFNSEKVTDQTKCHKCGKKDHFARDCWSKTSVSTYQSPFQPKLFSSPQHKPELRPTKDFEAKYNKVKAKLALLSSSASASKAFMVKNKGLIVEAYEWDEEEVSSDDNEMVEVKVLMALAEENDVVCKEDAKNAFSIKQAKLDFLTMQHVNTEILKENKNLRTELKELKAITETWLNSSNKVNQCISKQILSQKKRILGVDQLTEDPSNLGQKDIVFIKSSADDTKVTIPGVERPSLSEVEGFILPNHDTGRILPAKSQRNTIDPSVVVTYSSTTIYDSSDESLVCSTPLPPLKKLDGAEPISGTKTIKLILRSKSTFKIEALKCVIINEPSLAPAKGNKSSSALKVHSALAGKLKSVKIEDDHPLAIVMKELNNLKLQVSKNQKPIWYLDSGCSRHMTGVKSNLHKYVEQPGPKVVFGDDSTCTTKGYGSIKCNGIDSQRGTIFNSNKEVIMIDPRVRDVYVLDMTSSTHESCFLAKVFDNLNWLWHKRLAHLNFKTINKLAKQNLVIGLPSLYKVNAAEGVNAASEEVSIAELVSTAYVIKDMDRRFSTNGGLASKVPFSIPEDKAKRYFKVKARSTLMMGIPNEHQLKFNSIKDAKLFLEAIEKRFGGNEATKNTQMNLLKHQYENFTTTSLEMLDQTFDRLQKLRSKADLDTMRMDDLYNNLKVYEPEVKGIFSSSSSTQNMAFVFSSNNKTNSSNEAVNVVDGVTTSSTQVNTTYSTNIDNLSDAVICSFFASQPNNPQLAHEDLQQIYPDDIEEMDLRWQMAMLTIRARMFFKNTRMKLTINGNEIKGAC